MYSFKAKQEGLECDPCFVRKQAQHSPYQGQNLAKVVASVEGQRHLRIVLYTAQEVTTQKFLSLHLTDLGLQHKSAPQMVIQNGAEISWATYVYLVDLGPR